MSVGGTSSNQIEQVNETREQYAHNTFWNTGHQLLSPRDVVEGNVFHQDVSVTVCNVNIVLTLVHVVDQFNRILNESVGQVFDVETHNWGCTESTVFEAGWGLVPTPLPGTNDVSLSLGWEFSLGESGEANLQRTWEGEGTATSSTALSEVQYESATSSGSVFGSQQAEKRRSRKREEGGYCDVCNRQFSRTSDIRRHKKTTHTKEVHACSQCNIICSRRDALQRHIRDQHV